jgi:glycosyltransferase involved in cell wall biosynthesis
VTVSVVVAAYDEAAHLGRLLRSLMEQTEPPREVVVVDDGSGDDTARIATDHGAIVVRTEHRGAAEARNAGVARASGEIIVFIDADMVAGPTYVADLVAPIRAGATGSFTREIFVANAGDRWARAYGAIRRHPLPRLLADHGPDRSANFRAVRRRDFLRVGGYADVGYGEDLTLAARLEEPAVLAPGAMCWHFNPDSPWEIFENGRWIGRGHDIHALPQKWWRNAPPRSLILGLREAVRQRGWAPFVARQLYHAGVLTGLVEQTLGRHHAK